MHNLIYTSLFPQHLIELQKEAGGAFSLNNISSLDGLKHSLFLRDKGNVLHPFAVVQFCGYVKGELQEVWHLAGQALIAHGVSSLVVYGVPGEDAGRRIQQFARARKVRAFCLSEGDINGVVEVLRKHATN